MLFVKFSEMLFLKVARLGPIDFIGFLKTKEIIKNNKNDYFWRELKDEFFKKIYVERTQIGVDIQEI